MNEKSGSNQVLEENGRHVQTPEGRLDRVAQEVEAAAKSPLEHWNDGFLKGMATAARMVGTAGLGDKGAGVITEIADHIVMCGGLTDNERGQECAFWHVEGFWASEAEQEAARRIYESPDGKPVANAEVSAQLRGRYVAKAQQPEKMSD